MPLLINGDNISSDFAFRESFAEACVEFSSGKLTGKLFHSGLRRSLSLVTSGGRCFVKQAAQSNFLSITSSLTADIRPRSQRERAENLHHPTAPSSRGHVQDDLAGDLVVAAILVVRSWR